MTGGPPRILLVDDDEGYAALVRALLALELPDAEAIDHAGTLAAGRARLAAGRYDAVLLDNELPDGLGIDAIGAVHAIDPDAAVVLLSGMVDDDFAFRALRLGAQDALRKGEEAHGRLGAAVRAALHRTRVAAAARRAVGRIVAVVDHAPDHISARDLAGRYVLVNAAWSAAHRLLADEAVGRTAAELFGDAQGKRQGDTDRRALATGGPVRFDDRRDGRVLRTVAFVLRDEEGEVVGVCEIATDVTGLEQARADLERQRRRHELVLSSLPDMAVVLLDRELRVALLEGQLARRHGLDPAAATGRLLADLWPAAARGALLRALKAALRGAPQQLGLDGGDLPADVRIVPQPGPGGEVEGVLLLLQDTSAARAARRAREEAESRFRSAFEHAPHGMAIARPDGTLEAVNDALGRILGRDDLAGRRVDLGDGDGEHRLRHAGGHDVWVQVTSATLGAPAEAPRRFLQVVDITERRRFEERLDRLLHHDALTGLPNRRGLERALGEHLEAGGGGALVVLDLDDFKVVNDTLGHRAGDELIARAAGVLAARLGRTGLLAHLGGDAFAALLPDAGRLEALQTARALCDAVREHAAITAGGRRRAVTMSGGLMLIAPGADAEGLMSEADLAMYDAKEAGRDRVVEAGTGAAAAGMPQMRERVAWLDRLARALEDGAFVLHAQPVLDLVTGAVDHHELLLRLPDGRGGLVPPGTFLPVAEGAGLIVDLDRWVLRQAAAVLAAERAAGRPRRFSINLSARSIGEPALLADVEAALRGGGLHPSDLVVEMTETAAIANVSRAQAFAERLHELGLALSLDDFGVGFGSFYELKHLPCDEVKVDGEFVRGCAEDRTDRLVIRSLVELARDLGKRTVAEFVHDDPTAATVRDLGVDLGQGFHLGRPVPLEEALRPRRRAAAAPS